MMTSNARDGFGASGGNRRKAGGRLCFHLLAVLLAALWLLPVIGAIHAAGNALSASGGREHVLAVLRNAGIVAGLANGLLLAVSAVVCVLILASLAAFALAFYDFRLNRPVQILFAAGMLIPLPLLMIPAYRLACGLGIADTLAGVVLFQSAVQLGFATFFLRNAMETIPFSLVEASRLDGMGEFAIYRKVVLPLARPSLTAVGVLAFTWTWNDLVWPLVLIRSDSLKPVTLALATMDRQVPGGLSGAAALAAAAVPVILFLLFERHFVAGASLGLEKT